MLKRFRHSSIHRALTWLALCVWLTLTGATAVHVHPVHRAAAQGSAPAASSAANINTVAARRAAGRTVCAVAADKDDECSVCKWLCALGHTLLTCPLRIGLTRAGMPEHPRARPPTSLILAFASASRGPPASFLLS